MPVVDVPGVGRVGVGICKDMSVVPVGAVAGEHHMDNSFAAAAPTVPIERNPRADPSDSSAAARPRESLRLRSSSSA